jgi:hypothetical protein
MNSQISSKFAAFAVALMLNSLIIGGVAYLFDTQVDAHSMSVTMDCEVAPLKWLI